MYNAEYLQITQARPASFLPRSFSPRVLWILKIFSTETRTKRTWNIDRTGTARRPVARLARIFERFFTPNFSSRCCDIQQLDSPKRESCPLHEQPSEFERKVSKIQCVQWENVDDIFLRKNIPFVKYFARNDGTPEILLYTRLSVSRQVKISIFLEFDGR